MINTRGCRDLASSGYDFEKASSEAWTSLVEAEVFVEGDFTFASDIKATLKVDAENLYKHPRQLETIIGHFAAFPCVKDADALLYVPDGMRAFVNRLGNELSIPVAQTMRTPESSSRYDFMFSSEQDKELALSAEGPFIGEDVVTTLGSVAGLRKLLRPEQEVHSLAILLRGAPDPSYKENLIDHYLVEREIPLSFEDFHNII